MQLSHAFDRYKNGYRYLIELESKPWATLYQMYLQKLRQREQLLEKEIRVQTFIDAELPSLVETYTRRRYIRHNQRIL